MQNKQNKLTKMKYLRDEPVTTSGLAEMFQAPIAPKTVKNKISANQKDTARISFLISNDHDKAIKMYCAATGKKLKPIVIEALENFFAEGANKKLMNPHAYDGSGSRQQGVDVPVHLKKLLDEFVEQKKVPKRFVVEALISDYIKNN